MGPTDVSLSCAAVNDIFIENIAQMQYLLIENAAVGLKITCFPCSFNVYKNHLKQRLRKSSEVETNSRRFMRYTPIIELIVKEMAGLD